jgi:hypothetical protein
MPRTLELDDAWPAALGRPGEPAAPATVRERPSDV